MIPIVTLIRLPPHYTSSINRPILLIYHSSKRPEQDRRYMSGDRPLLTNYQRELIHGLQRDLRTTTATILRLQQRVVDQESRAAEIHRKIIRLSRPSFSYTAHHSVNEISVKSFERYFWENYYSLCDRAISLEQIIPFSALLVFENTQKIYEQEFDYQLDLHFFWETHLSIAPDPHEYFTSPSN